jgi:hypothetical protein
MDQFLLFHCDFLSFRIIGGIQKGTAAKTCLGACGANEVQDRCIIAQWFTLPVGADGAEQTMLNRIPLRCSWWIMGHGDGDSPFVRHLLQRPLPKPRTGTVGTTAVRYQQPMLRPRVTPQTFLFPPLAQSRRRECGCLPRSSNHHEPQLLQLVVDAERNRAPQTKVRKIMVPYVVRLTPPRPTGILKQANLFLLLGIDADRRISLFLEATPLPGNVAELPIALRFVGSGQTFAVGSQGVFLGLSGCSKISWSFFQSQTLQRL